jgi:uncharacterized membrane protein
MKRWTGPIIALLVCAAVMHLAVLHLAPGVIMSQAMAMLAERGVQLHRFSVPERITPLTQRVVRSSPDIFYALCRYDLSNPGQELSLHMGAWPDYQSLSLFSAQTDNFATLRGTGKAIAVRLLPPGSPAEDGAIVSPTAKGVILIRRLAPDAARFAAAVEASKGDACRIGWRGRIGASSPAH